ncbi:NAD-dependent epimerase/dehydratase family protein [Miltoncostaea marina]|uniref:NAD-dependent epimerase/dehydratase family protein n=1 Tax=Miltoncostaea marina TaxID=2843215 RepID=UPI001C3DB987|nr:NAD-dependent epimerase/dehydratase family protein [Miltoncostaea marina]
MRVVVTGATGNVGTALLRALAVEPRVASVLGVARRPPAEPPPGTEWMAADVADAELEPAFAGADAVVHLAWAIRPSHDMARLWRTNVLGSARVFAAARAAGVPALVHASSVGAYSPGPKDRRVDESWPARGLASSFYAVHKAECERRLDILEREAPGMRVVRMRPGLIFSRRASSRVARLFLGPLAPRAAARPSRLPVVPDIPGLRVQAVHSDDVADAYRLAIVRDDARGAFNVAAEPPLDPASVAGILGARRVPVPARLVRAVVDASWRARLQPTPPGWLDMALAVPLMDCSRARDLLGWRPARSSGEALRELLEGVADGAGGPTPALRPGR